MEKIWIVLLDNEPKYASTDYHEAYSRFFQLRNGFGDNRVRLVRRKWYVKWTVE